MGASSIASVISYRKYCVAVRSVSNGAERMEAVSSAQADKITIQLPQKAHTKYLVGGMVQNKFSRYASTITAMVLCILFYCPPGTASKVMTTTHTSRCHSNVYVSSNHHSNCRVSSDMGEAFQWIMGSWLLN